MKLLKVIITLLVCTIIFVSLGCAKSPASDGDTIKIGIVDWMGWPLGIDMVHATEIRVAQDNAAGGLKIGGKNYKIELIVYDNKADPASNTAAVNRLIFEDGVKFIITGYFFANEVWPLTEANKVINIGAPTEPTPPMLAPANKYSFEGWVTYNETSSWGWLAQKYPDKKTVFAANMDNQMGHDLDATQRKNIEAFGFKQIAAEFYPETITDCSALGLKGANMNPDIFVVAGGGPAIDSLVVKALYEAGYKGLKFSTITETAAAYTSIAGNEGAEGLIGAAWPVEFDPTTTEIAKQFKADWIAKFGAWEGPEIQGEIPYEILRAALVKAGSIDTDKVSAAISNGLKWEGPQGPGMMVSRPDLDNTRTVSSIIGWDMKTIKGGQPVTLGKVSLQDAAKYFSQVWK